MNTPNWVVEAVQAQENYSLLLRFADGSKKVFNILPLLDKPIYTELRNTSFFMTARIECGTVVWNDEVDIAPEYLYENSVPVSQ